MAIDLEKESKDLGKYIDYVKAQINYTEEELKEDLLKRGLSDDEVSYVMTFCKPHVKQRMFSHPFSFRGRIRRLEYCLSLIIVYIYISIIEQFTDIITDTTLGAIFLLISLIPLYWFLWAQGAKRCHDRDNSGFYQIIPFYGLWMMFGDGNECENEYGFDPKGRNIFSE